jgi:serine/threonine protein phosphatase PrpC
LTVIPLVRKAQQGYESWCKSWRPLCCNYRGYRRPGHVRQTLDRGDISSLDIYSIGHHSLVAESPLALSLNKTMGCVHGKTAASVRLDEVVENSAINKGLEDEFEVHPATSDSDDSIRDVLGLPVRVPSRMGSRAASRAGSEKGTPKLRSENGTPKLKSESGTPKVRMDSWTPKSKSKVGASNVKPEDGIFKVKSDSFLKSKMKPENNSSSQSMPHQFGSNGRGQDSLLLPSLDLDLGMSHLNHLPDQCLPASGCRVVKVPAGGYELRYSSLTQRGYYPEAPDKVNQDSSCVHMGFGGNPSHHFFGVFDGHGEFGAHCSQFAKKHLCENLLRSSHFPSDMLQAYNSSFVSTNMQLHQFNIDDSMSGTTAVTVLVRGRTLYVANVGDSRAVIAEWKGKNLVAVDLSSDQTPFRTDECARVKSCGARVLTLDQLEGLKDPHIQCWGREDDDDGDPPRLWVANGMYPGTAFTRSIGDSTAEQIGVIAVPEVLVMELTAKHPFFVIASDGVFEFLSSQAVVDMVGFSICIFAFFNCCFFLHYPQVCSVIVCPGKRITSLNILFESVSSSCMLQLCYPHQDMGIICCVVMIAGH